MKEAVVEAHLRKRIRALGGECRKVTFPGHRGAPDRLVLLEGDVYWVELKAPNGTLAPHQAREHQTLERHGQCVLTLWSKEQIDRVFPLLRRVA